VSVARRCMRARAARGEGGIEPVPARLSSAPRPSAPAMDAVRTWLLFISGESNDVKDCELEEEEGEDAGEGDEGADGTGGPRGLPAAYDERAGAGREGEEWKVAVGGVWSSSCSENMRESGAGSKLRYAIRARGALRGLIKRVLGAKRVVVVYVCSCV
jgi:hypothetical protein